MIPDDVVDEVRARADIVEIIGEHVALKRAGKDFKARCPFHEETDAELLCRARPKGSTNVSAAMNPGMSSPSS